VYRARLARGDWGDPHAHLHQAHHPEPPPPKVRRLVEFWAALSGALALPVIVGILVLWPPFWWLWCLAIVVGFVAVEAATRGRVANFLLNTVIILAIITTLILLWEFWWVVLLAALAGVALYVVRDNLRELVRK
jgi:hypothetical protein